MPSGRTWRGAPAYPRSPDTIVAAIFGALLVLLVILAIGWSVGASHHLDHVPPPSPTAAGPVARGQS